MVPSSFLIEWQFRPLLYCPHWQILRPASSSFLLSLDFDLFLVKSAAL